MGSSIRLTTFYGITSKSNLGKICKIPQIPRIVIQKIEGLIHHNSKREKILRLQK